MAGLRKQKKYDWKDSNMALFGSDTERQVKKESAQHEPAWKKAGENVGLQIWRIVKFKVTSWPKEDYGKFYNGDSYIILNTYKEEACEELLYDVHFWIGKYSTQDEYGTAAYKTVELDTFLDDKPIQHREVQGYESELFQSYFKEITYLEGGADSGFRHVKPETYTPRLLHFHGDRHKVVVKQVCMKRTLDNTDVYILDCGLNLYQWNGSGSNKDERHKAMQYVRELANDRGGKSKVEVLDEGTVEDDHEFTKTLGAAAEEDDDDDDTQQASTSSDQTKELFRLSDASGKMQMSLQKSGKICNSDLDPKDVFILDDRKNIFVWIGKDTSRDEKLNALTYAHNYLMKTDHPFLPVSCFPQGRENKDFRLAIAA